LVSVFITIFSILMIISKYQITEVKIDLENSEVRKYYIIFNRKVKNKLLYKDIANLNYGWMLGEVRGGDDNPPIEGIELIAYKNKNVHKDLMFFERKRTTENLTKIFKEKINLKIHDRIKNETNSKCIN
jgi:hypothetical protein